MTLQDLIDAAQGRDPKTVEIFCNDICAARDFWDAPDGATLVNGKLVIETSDEKHWPTDEDMEALSEM